MEAKDSKRVAVSAIVIVGLVSFSDPPPTAPLTSIPFHDGQSNVIPEVEEEEDEPSRQQLGFSEELGGQCHGIYCRPYPHPNYGNVGSWVLPSGNKMSSIAKDEETASNRLPDMGFKPSPLRKEVDAAGEWGSNRGGDSTGTVDIAAGVGDSSGTSGGGGGGGNIMTSSGVNEQAGEEEEDGFEDDLDPSEEEEEDEWAFWAEKREAVSDNSDEDEDEDFYSEGQWELGVENVGVEHVSHPSCCDDSWLP